jgi:hypothetical protein
MAKNMIKNMAQTVIFPALALSGALGLEAFVAPALRFWDPSLHMFAMRKLLPNTETRPYQKGTGRKG